MRYFKSLVVRELEYNIGFVTERSPNIWWYDGQRVAFRAASSGHLLRMLQLRPDASLDELSKEAGISQTAVKKQLAQMTEKGYLQRRDLNGEWMVLATPSV